MSEKTKEQLKKDLSEKEAELEELKAAVRQVMPELHRSLELASYTSDAYQGYKTLKRLVRE